VFFSPSWPRRRERATADVAPTRLPRLAVPLLGAYCALQLLLPIRFLAYGGNVRWHEQGMRFSWRVMVREKNGSVTYLVRNKQTGRVWQVDPRRYLTSVQEREISGQPDLILQLAHHVARDFEQRGLGPVEVRVDAQASLNGRPSAPLIDPNIDLTTIEDGVTQASWILPAPDQAPPHIRPI
jgi:vitamin K-dependent gamma-carboxylase